MAQSQSLACSLPSYLPPRVQRIISEYTRKPDDGPVAVGGMVRINVWDQLHDAYVLLEEEDFVLLLTKCGVTVRVPQSEMGGMKWPVEVDSNPPNCASLTPEWFLLATDRPRGEQVALIDVHLPPARRPPTSPFAPPPSCHRRVRLLSTHEDRHHPNRPPVFVYMKMFFPYFALRALPRPRPSSARPLSAMSRALAQAQLQQDMQYSCLRESAAYSVLHHCEVQVAPQCFYSSFNEETGSYNIIIEDVINLLDWDPIKEQPLPKTDKEEAQQKEAHKQMIKRLKKLFAALASLHGRFFKNHEGLVPVSKELLKAFVHPKLFWVGWDSAIPEDEELSELLQEIYGFERPPTHPSGPSPEPKVLRNTEDNETPPEENTGIAEDREANEEHDGGEVQPETQPQATEVEDEGEEVKGNEEGRGVNEEGENKQEPEEETNEDEGEEERDVIVTATMNEDGERGEEEHQRSNRGSRRDLQQQKQAPSEVDNAQRRNLVAFPSFCRRDELVNPQFLGNSSLTLIHGRLHDAAHIKLHPDTRAVPNLQILDWKYAGIGPSEVDLLQALMLVPPATRRKDPDLIYHALYEYCEVLRLFYPNVPASYRSLPELLCRMRQVALVFIGTDPMDWNDQSQIDSQYVLLHHELCDKTTRAHLKVLQERVDNGEFEQLL